MSPPPASIAAGQRMMAHRGLALRADAFAVHLRTLVAR